jgi:hypothetical protein
MKIAAIVAILCAAALSSAHTPPIDNTNYGIPSIRNRQDIFLPWLEEAEAKGNVPEEWYNLVTRVASDKGVGTKWTIDRWQLLLDRFGARPHAGTPGAKSIIDAARTCAAFTETTNDIQIDTATQAREWSLSIIGFIDAIDADEYTQRRWCASLWLWPDAVPPLDWQPPTKLSIPKIKPSGGNGPAWRKTLKRETPDNDDPAFMPRRKQGPLTPIPDEILRRAEENRQHGDPRDSVIAEDANDDVTQTHIDL